MPVVTQAQRLACREAAGRKSQAAEEGSTIGINHELFLMLVVERARRSAGALVGVLQTVAALDRRVPGDFREISGRSRPQSGEPGLRAATSQKTAVLASYERGC